MLLKKNQEGKICFSMCKEMVQRHNNKKKARYGFGSKRKIN